MRSPDVDAARWVVLGGAFVPAPTPRRRRRRWALPLLCTAVLAVGCSIALIAVGGDSWFAEDATRLDALPQRRIGLQHRIPPKATTSSSSSLPAAIDAAHAPRQDRVFPVDGGAASPSTRRHPANPEVVLAPHGVESGGGGGGGGCDAVASINRVVGDWRRGVRTVCFDEPTGIRIREYVQRNFQYKPQIVLYENVDVEYFNGAVMPNPCPKGSTYLEEEKRNVFPPWAQGEGHDDRGESRRRAADGVGVGGSGGRAAYAQRVVRCVDNRTFLRIKRFDVYNSYEAFHAYLNTFFLLQVLRLNQTDVQFVFTDVRRGDSPRDEMWWNSINRGRYPIVFSNNNGQRNIGMVDGVPYRLRSMVTASSSGTSMLTSKHGALRGRRRDHHCKSPAFQEAVSWFRSNFKVFNNISFSLQRPKRTNDTAEEVRVLWSSRRPYRREGVLKPVHRQLPREDEFLAMLQRLLSSMDSSAQADEPAVSQRRRNTRDTTNMTGRETVPMQQRRRQFVVESVDFGAIDPHVAVETASNADVIVGAHGAGLMWSAFLPRHGGLVELFGGNRGAINRHYHNLASLADLHYRSHTLAAPTSSSPQHPSPSSGGRSRRTGIAWRGRDVHAIARLILSIPLYRDG